MGTNSTLMGARGWHRPLVPLGRGSDDYPGAVLGAVTASATIQEILWGAGEQRLLHTSPVPPVFLLLQPSGCSPPRFPSVISVTGTAERKGTELSPHQF